MASPADAALGAIKSVMPTVLIAGIAALLLRFLARQLFDKLRDDRGSEFRYVAVKHVASPPERVLYERLRAALPDLVVLAQVQLSRVIKPVSQGHAPLNKIIRKSLDFVVCDPSFAPLIAIEVNDRSHEAADRIAADADKAAALRSAGIPLIKWEARRLPNVDEIRAAVSDLITPKKTGRIEPSIAPIPTTARDRPAPDLD